jgi:hypothetical protein
MVLQHLKIIPRREEKRKLTQAALDRGFAPRVSGAIFPNWFRAKARQGQTRPGK